MAAVSEVAPASDASYELSVKTVERWAQTGASDDEKLEDAIKDLGESGNIQVFQQAMEALGVRATQTDNAFYRVKSTIDKFAAKHWVDFPGILHISKSGMVIHRTGRNISTLQEISRPRRLQNMNLQQVKNITTKEEIFALAAYLKEFAKNKPVGIPVNFQDKLLDLKRNVEDFQARFNTYLDEQNAKLTAEAERLKNDINNLKLEIASLDKEIDDATLALAIASWFGPIGAAIAGTSLAVLANRRADKQKALDRKKDEMKRVEAKQTALAAIKAQFDALVPDFALLAANLGLFASTWNAFHHEAIDFATKFQEAQIPANLTELYKLRVELAIKVSVPLALGLRAYAASFQ